MATQFKEIRSLARAIMLDVDDQNFMYPDAVIDSHIKLIVMVENKTTIQMPDEETTPPAFTATLTPTDKALLAYLVARSIISPNPDYFTYKSPVLTVARAGGTIQLLNQIQRQLDQLQGGFLALKEDNELWALVNGPVRWARDWNALPMEG